MLAALVAASLLCLSGDIETNPGPPFELNSSNLRLLVRLLGQVQNEWFQLGLQLKLESHELDTIRSDYPTTMERCTEMLTQWLRMISPRPSWEGLLRALAIVNRKDVALKIAKDHDIPFPEDWSAEDWEVESTSSLSSIPESVQQDMGVLEHLFSELVDGTEQVIKESQISVKMFKSHLLKLNVQNKLQHREFLAATLPKISKDSIFEDIWEPFCGYFNFLNYSLLEHLVKRLGDTRLVDRFEDYKDRLRSFRSTTLVRDFAVFIVELKKPSLSKQRLKRIIIKSKKSWDSCTLEDLERSKQNISKKFFIPTNFLSMLDAESSCVSVTWAVPDTIAASIQVNFDRADVVDLCKAEEIISIEIDAKEYNYLQAPHSNCTLIESTVQTDITTLEDMVFEIEDSVFSSVETTDSGLNELLEMCDIETHEETSLDTTRQQLSTRWDFTDLTLFKNLSRKFDDGSLRVSVEDCSRKLEAFLCRTTVSEFAMHAIQIGKTIRDGEFSNIVIQVNQSPNHYMLKKLQSLKASIIFNFGLPRFSLLLQSIKVSVSSFEVTWATPAKVAQPLKEKNVMDDTSNRPFYKSFKVGSVTIDGRKYLAIDNHGSRAVSTLAPGRQILRGMSSHQNYSAHFGKCRKFRKRDFVVLTILCFILWFLYTMYRFS